MNTVREVCQQIGKLVGKHPLCVETGCTYICEPGNEVHTTTNNLLKFVCAPNQGHLASYDIDSEHIEFAREFVKGIEGGVWTSFLGDSVERMSDHFSMLEEKDKCIDVLCLDSKEFDEDHMVNEYKTVKHLLKDCHFVLVDDIHNPNSVKYKKMVPLLKKAAYEWVEIPTPTGMFVATKGYSLDGFRD